VNEWGDAGGPDELQKVEALKTALYDLLAPYLDRRRLAFYGPWVREPAESAHEDPVPVMEAYGEALGLTAFDGLGDARLAAVITECTEPDLRAQLIKAYLGFPFYDIAIFPLLQGEGLDEFDEIKVDRISPDDARAIREGGALATLKGIKFNSFGAFFSRAYRENDYLWGRLHGVDRVIDIVVSALPENAHLEPGVVAGLKKRAFHAILDAEAPRLGTIPDLIAELRREIG
jgi:hypothetical protein